MQPVDLTKIEKTDYSAGSKQPEQYSPTNPNAIDSKLLSIQLCYAEQIMETLNTEFKHWKQEISVVDTISSQTEEILAKVEDYDEKAYIEFKKALTTDQKKDLITALPHWLESHFPTQTSEFKIAFEGLYYNFEGQSANEIDRIFKELEESITHLLCQHKFSLALRGLTLPKNEKTTATIAEHLIFKAWQHALKIQKESFNQAIQEIAMKIFPAKIEEKQKPYSYAWCNGDKFSHDSHRILLKALKKESNILVKNCILLDLERSKKFDHLVMHMGLASFTISIGTPTTN